MRRLACTGAALVALGLAACGSGEDAKVGDCIDLAHKVVPCDSGQAAQKLVSDQSKKDATACIKIGDKPQSEENVGGKEFCAEKVKPNP